MSLPSQVVEFPPLLPAGLHTVTLAEFEDLCVASKAFTLSTTRRMIFQGFLRILEALKRVGIHEGEIWADGSFLTAKIDPKDIDFVVCLPAEVYENGTSEQQLVLDSIAEDDLKSSHYCDCYLSFDWPKDSLLHEEGERNRQYWHNQFGYSRSQEPKGMMVLKLSEVIL